MSEVTFRPSQIWPDDRRMHINAHGGGILRHGSVYYWYGEHKIEGAAGNRAHVGVHCYSSTDLYSWHDEGIALAVSDDAASPIRRGCVLERPKVLYNAATRRFVMWFHLETATDYTAAMSGVAVSASPAGPFTFLYAMRPNAGHWPLNVREDQKSPASIAAAVAEWEAFSNGENPKTPQFNILGRDMAGGQHARDMTLFQDNDGSAYHVYSSEHNSTLHIARLTDDYLRHSGEYVRVFEHRWMEAPALFHHAGKYYFIGSGCTGWAPNSARAAVADSIYGPWRELGNPCTGVNPTNGMGADLTFGGQSTFVLPVAGREGAFIALFDEWRPQNAIDGRYIWLPVEFSGEGFAIHWRDEWDLTFF